MLLLCCTNFWLFRIWLGLRSLSGFFCWLSIELNLLGFLLLLLSLFNNSVWVTIKYFLVQSLASVVFLFFLFSSSWGAGIASLGFLQFRIALKLAAAPFQFWLINIIRDISWIRFLFVGTIQKVLPLFFMGIAVTPIINTFIFLGLLVGVAGGYQSVLLKRVLVYSSVLRIRWMFRSQNFRGVLWFLFFYSVGLRILIEQQTDISEGGANSQIWKSLPQTDKFLALMALLSLLGMPPLLGFLGKLILLCDIVQIRGMFLTASLLSARAVFIIIYLRVALSGVVGGENQSLIYWEKGRFSSSITFITFITPLVIFLLYAYRFWNLTPI